MEDSRGPARLLSRPRLYDGLQRLLGAEKSRAIYVREHVRPRPGDRILDIGCGTAAILEHLPRTDYTGLDPEASYIDSAKRRFGGRGSFFCAGVGDAALDRLAPGFDIVLANGVLHHLDDGRVLALLRGARRLLKSGGVLFTLDPVFTSGQSVFARWIISRDRGAYVRAAEGYDRLARQTFEHVRSTIRDDLMRIPYTHLVMECR